MGGWGWVYCDGPVPGQQNSRTKSGTIVLKHSVQKYNVLIFNSGELAGAVVPRGRPVIDDITGRAHLTESDTPENDVLGEMSDQRHIASQEMVRRGAQDHVGKLFTLHPGYSRG